jgi:tetratricopeptide (TPR) repeat protein
VRSDRFWSWFDSDARLRLGARADTFAKMFAHLDGFDRPVTIAETGCCRRDPADDESWKGDGCSTVLFDRYVTARADGSLCGSVDLDVGAVAIAAEATEWVSLSVGDSVHWLRSLSDSLMATQHGGVDLLYLDSFDYSPGDPLPSAIHHHAELMAAMPVIRPDTLVVVDDAWAAIDDQGRAEVGGKGFLVARHMLLCGADLVFCQYQSGWIGVRAATPRGDEELAALVGRARAHVEGDRIVAAEQLYRLILGLTTPPTTGQARVAHGEACAFYAKMALLKQRFGQAADWYREAIQADPLGTDYRVELVLRCFLPMGNLRAALVEAERAVRVAPDYAQTWRVLGGVQHEMGNARKAIEAYDKQIALDPSDPNALLDRATIALDVADYDKVRELCAAVLETDRRPDALHCLGMVAYRESRHEDAIALYDQAIAAEARDLPIVRWNKSLALHAIGRYREGWREHEHREFQKSNPVLYLPMRRFTLPRWRGEPAQIAMTEEESVKANEGSRGGIRTHRAAIIHVHYEAGAGDNLAMARFLRVLRERGFRVRYECADEMVDLMRGSFPDVEVMPKAADYPGALGIVPFDYHIPVGSLPAVLGTEVDSIPWPGPYIKADPILADRFRARLGKRDGRPRVGLCWSSGIRDGVWMREYGLRKSMHVSALDPILWEHRAFISLQVGPERAQLAEKRPWAVYGQEPFYKIADVLPERPSWAETAALVANLDLVITVDTAVAHLAGAMGKPVWVMCQRDAASWHFMCWREGAPWNERSPWYPSARIFRQHRFDEPHRWGDVVDDVAAALRSWADQNRAKETAA